MKILSDQGPEFESELFQELCRLMEIDKIRTTLYRPSTNSTAERFHRTLKSMLAKAITQDNQRDWNLRLPFVMAAYRAPKHESTGYSPNFLIFGREARAPIDVVLGPPPVDEETFSSADEFVAQMQPMQHESYALAREHLGAAAERRKDAYDIKTKPARFEVGQWVWYIYPRRYVGRSPKWNKCYQEPYLVTIAIPPCDFVIQRTRKGNLFVVHGDKLKPYYGETPASWPPKTAAEQSTSVVPDTGNAVDAPQDDSAVAPPAKMSRRRHRQPEHHSDNEIGRRQRRRPAYLDDYQL